MEIDKSWLPTPANINALPKPVRSYIHDLGTLCDPQYIMQENVLLKDENDQLRAKIKELRSGEQ